MEYFPPDSITLLGIGYRLLTPFGDNDTAQVGFATFPEIWFGDTAEHKRFGVLSVELHSTDWFGAGFLPIFYQDTSSDGMSLTAYIHNENQLTNATAIGEIELWMQYRVRSGRSANRGSNVV
jgi:hypothetical protein